MKTTYIPDRKWKLERFGPGPWMDEPDHAQWVSEDGLPCIVVRMVTGCWAGYVGVGPTHPLYRVSHDDLVLIENVVVSGHSYGMGLADGTFVEVDHDPAYWFFGFDYSHGHDFIPQHENWKVGHYKRARPEIPLRSRGEGPHAYADFVYIRKQCELQAFQLSKPEFVLRTSDPAKDDDHA